MIAKKWALQLEAGEEFDTLEFCVTPSFNQQYLEAVEDYHPRYLEIVHPALLINYSNVTRSPSFRLPPGVAAVHTHEEIEYINPGRVGNTFRASWKVVDVYKRRGRLYQVKEALVVDQDGVKIIKRRITDTYVSGQE